MDDLFFVVLSSGSIQNASIKCKRFHDLDRKVVPPIDEKCLKFTFLPFYRGYPQWAPFPQNS
jgi:hypothetical protein